MTPINQYAPSEIRIWQVAGVLHANIPRSVVRMPRIIAHRPNAPEPGIGHRELADLALNILNLLMPPQVNAGGDLEPVRCFRGRCSAFAARHHGDFVREFIQPLPAGGCGIRTADIVDWIESRRRTERGPSAAAAAALSA